MGHSAWRIGFFTLAIAVAGKPATAAAPGDGVPLIHFRQTAALLRACKSELAAPEPAKAKHPLCAGIIGVSRGIDPRVPPTAAQQTRLSGLRKGIVDRFQAEFKPDSLFGRPDWARRIRILGYADTADFLGWSRKQGYLEDSVVLPLAAARARLQKDTLAPARRLLAAPLPVPEKGAAGWTPEDLLAFCFRLLAPDLERQLALDAYSREAHAAGPCLRDPGCADLQAEFELQHLAEGADADSLRLRLDVRRIAPFIHKLKICLGDAIWFDDGRNPSPFAYSGYLFNGAHPLAPSDSALVVAAIEAFGRENAGLRQRVDEPGWDRKKADDLDARADAAVRSILKSCSRELSSYLTRRAESETVRVRIPGTTHPDVVGEFRLAKSLGEWLAGPIDAGEQRALSLFVDGASISAARSASEKSPRAGAAALLEGLSPSGYGYIQLLLGPMMELRYAGSIAALKKSLDPRWRI